MSRTHSSDGKREKRTEQASMSMTHSSAGERENGTSVDVKDAFERWWTRERNKRRCQGAFEDGERENGTIKDTFERL